MDTRTEERLNQQQRSYRSNPDYKPRFPLYAYIIAWACIILALGGALGIVAIGVTTALGI